MEPVEDAEWESDMADHTPLKGSIELYLPKLIEGRLLHKDVEDVVDQV